MAQNPWLGKGLTNYLSVQPSRGSLHVARMAGQAGANMRGEEDSMWIIGIYKLCLTCHRHKKIMRKKKTKYIYINPMRT